MGHWEQTAVNNMKHRERQARKSALRLRIEKALIWLFITVFCAGYWAAVFIMAWRMIKDLPLL